MTPARRGSLRSRRRERRAKIVVLLALAVVAAVLVVGDLGEGPAPVSPGSFTGYAFDARCAPNQKQMDAWRTSSPFWGVGVYIGGSTRGCHDQPNLTDAWVRTQSARGWRVLPIWVGPQASCAGYADRIDPDPAHDYAAARAQGRRQAARAAEVADALAFSRRTTLWYDIEAFTLGDTGCRRSALGFLSAWTGGLHRLGFRSGVYSSVASGIQALDYADSASPGSYQMPDQVWFAWDNGRPDTAVPSNWVRPRSWAQDRVHQYALDRHVTYGGVTLAVDRSFVDVGRGSVAPREPLPCGVSIDFARYRRLDLGATGAQVKAAQCLLRKKDLYDGRVDGRFDGATAAAVRAFQRTRPLEVTGAIEAGTWTALLADGSAPLLKRGSAGNAVRRAQRALNAADGAGLPVSGVYGAATARAVRDYQRGRGLAPTGIAAAGTWADLRAGRR